MIGLILMAQLQLAEVRVIDGDTLAAGAERYRLSGIDAPEIRDAACPAERALGERAKARLEELARVGVVAIPDPEAKGRKRWTLDKYGRRLARIEVGGADAGAVLIAEGLAVRWIPGEAHDWCGN